MMFQSIKSTAKIPEGTSRREFVQFALLSPAAIAIAGSTLTGCAGQTKPSRTSGTAYKELDDDAGAMWRKVVFAVTEGISDTGQSSGLSDQEATTIISGIDNGIHHFSRHNKEELKSLFTLLALTLTRGLTTGIWSDWPEASREEVNEFLTDWKNSRLSLFNKGYNGLVQLAAMSAYGAPEYWKASGYAGPPPEVTGALPQFSMQRANQEAIG